MDKSGIKPILVFIAISLLLISILSGCEKEQKPEPTIIEVEVPAEDETAQESPEEQTEAAEEKTEAPEQTSVTPVPERSRYKLAEPAPSKTPRDYCGCSFTWDPVCGNDKKTYINDCIFKCFGHTMDELGSNSQCPMRKSEPNIYTDDLEMKYDSYKWNGGYCWREMLFDAGIRECKNIIVNGRVNKLPAPARGNWLEAEHLTLDKEGESESYAIKLVPGFQASNEEYNTSFQPLFEKGKYSFTFWARQDSVANNDWRVKLTLKDWWESKPMANGVKGCYILSTTVRAEEVYIDTLPNRWRRYNYEFDVPLNLSQWETSSRESADCEYNWDMIPHGYRIDATGPTIGSAYFDDFSIVRQER